MRLVIRRYARGVEDWRWWAWRAAPGFLALSLFLEAPRLFSSAVAGASGPWIDSFLDYWVCWMLWLLAGPALFWFLCWAPIEGRNYLRAAALHVIAALVFVVFHIGLHTAVAATQAVSHADLLKRSIAYFFALLQGTIVMELIIFLMIDGLFHSVRFAVRAQSSAIRERDLILQKTEAELEALRRRLEPHFLFNALNSLCAMLNEGSPARQMATRLSEYLRLVLDRTNSEKVSLREEIGLVNSYLEIEALRHGTRLKTRFSVTAEALSALTPVLVLQPLVENAVRHATACPAQTVSVDIAAYVEGSKLVLSVRNSPSAPLTAITGEGMGQAIIRERLEANYGSLAKMAIRTEQNAYAVQVSLPLERAP